METKCKKCGMTENVNFDGMCKKCYEDSIVINETKENIEKKKNGFFSDKKNIAITILSILVILLFISYPTNENNTNTVPTSSDSLTANLEQKITTLSNDLKEANQKIKTLEENNQNLSKEKEDLTAKIQSVEELQKTVDEKNQYILNLESQVGSLTAEKAQLEGQKGILEQQLANSNKQASSAPVKTTTQSSSSTSATNSYTVYVTNTGSKYHRSGCSYLRQSSNSIDKNSAVSKGYTPCSRCNP